MQIKSFTPLFTFVLNPLFRLPTYAEINELRDERSERLIYWYSSRYLYVKYVIIITIWTHLTDCDEHEHEQD